MSDRYQNATLRSQVPLSLIYPMLDYGLSAVQERLHVRISFTARAEIIRENISAVLTARVTEISLHGCYLEFVQIQKGSHILVKIVSHADVFEASANVIYSQPDLGTALAFRSIQPHCMEVLKAWWAESVQKESAGAVTLQVVNWAARIYVNNELRLEAPLNYGPVAPTLETDMQLKRWADYVQKMNSDDSAARFFGKSALTADGFTQGNDSVWRRH